MIYEYMLFVFDIYFDFDVFFEFNLSKFL